MSASTASENVRRVLTEDCLTLSEARNEIKAVTGRRPDKTTVYRWINRGVRGTKLEAVRLGGVIITSRQAITRFIEQRSAKG